MNTGQLVELLNDHFVNVGGERDLTAAPTVVPHKLEPVSIGQVKSMLKNVNPNKSPNCEDWPAWITKAACEDLCIPVTDIYNCMLATNTYPNVWKTAEIRPLKKTKNPEKTSDYRPISLLHHLGKIAEEVILQRLQSSLGDKLDKNQYAYQRNLSTTDALLDVIHNWCLELDDLKTSHVSSAFVDMSKAFDSISHATLFRKLEFYGIRGNVLAWFKSYLLNRQIKVKYRNVLSETYEMTYGTPQGSVLGPLMYIILANDLVKILRCCNCVTFADDTMVFASGSNRRVFYLKVNSDLYRLTEWFDSNYLTLNIDKSKYIIFRPRRKKELNFKGSIRVGGKEISRVENIKFLGIIVDEFLDWNQQLKHILIKMIAGNYSLNMIKNS